MTAVSEPTTEAELAAAVSEARAAQMPLAVEGRGTKSGIGRPAQAEATLSTVKLSGITLYEPSELVIGAKAGTPLAEIEAALAEKGQMLPFEPIDYRPILAGSGGPTIGGVAAGNLSGPRRIATGACRDSLIGVRFVNGRGEIVKNGGRVMKNVTGLDLVKLMAGSWGTLGVMSEVIFKILPVAETNATLLLHGLDDARAVEALAAGLGSPFEVTGAAHLPAGIDRVPTTLLRIEGFAPSIAYRKERLRALLKPFGAADVLEGEAAADLWRRVRDAAFLAEPRDKAVWRVSIAPSKAPSFVERLQALRDFRRFYDWGGGLVWIATEAAGDAGSAAIRTALAGTGGHATLIRAPAEIRAAADVFEPLPPALRTVTEGIKTSLDPDRLFNPGRMYAGI
jgi:glycolate oxidase FAD binding subunit